MRTLLLSFPVRTFSLILKLALLVAGFLMGVRAFSQCTPTFDSEPADITVSCDESLPVFPLCSSAVSDCCDGPVAVTSFMSETGGIVEDCVISTAFGPGPDWAIWLPDIDAPSVSWNFVGEAHLQVYTDGTGHLWGTVANSADASLVFEVDMWFQNGRNWADWSALGREYKNDLGLAGSNYLNWTYYELVPGFATFTGTGALAGSQLTLHHQPANYFYGFQLGVAANNKNANNGFSGWFTYDGIYDGETVTGHGDVNVDKNCEEGNEDCAATAYTQICRAQDSCGNIAYSSQTIYVVDEAAPVVDAYDNPLVISDPLADITAIFITATDNCSSVTITYTDEVIVAGAQIIRHYTITDGCGNSTTADQTIFLQTETEPEFTVFPGDITVNCDEVDALPEPAVEWVGGCANIQLTVTDNLIPGECPGSYVVEHVYTLTDDCDNEISATYTVTVVDITPPQILDVPADITVGCGADIPVAVPVAIDNCDPEVMVALEATTTMLDCGYIFTRTWTATDNCGNTTSASQQVLVSDDIDPVFTFLPPNVTINCDEDFTLDMAIVADACSHVDLEWTDVPLGDCAGSYMRLWRAFDGCGNQALESTTVTIIDDTPPVMTQFPEDTSVNCDEVPELSADDIVYSDICSAVNVTYTETSIEGSCENSYTLLRTWLLTDACGNSSEWTWTITVTDNEGPQLIGVPEDASINCGDEVSDAVVIATDNCDSEVAVSLEATTETADCGYLFIRTWTATDACGNSTQASQTIAVNDQADPVFTFVPADINLACTNGTTIDDLPIAEATDDCSVVIVTFEDVALGGNCGNGLLRTFTATDGCGNTATAEQLISFSDETPPVFTFVPENIEVPCGGDYELADATAEDNCSSVSITFEDAPGVGCAGSFIRTFTATDGCGNTATATVSVLFTDDEAPVVISAPLDITVNCDAVPTAEDANLEYSDNCGSVNVDYTENIFTSDECDGNYVISRTWNLADECGNATSVTWTITVVDNTMPTLIGVPENVSINCGDEITEAVVIATDNCDGDVTVALSAETFPSQCGYVFIRRWTATDDCGNEASATQVITLADVLPPVFTFVPADITVNCGDGIADLEIEPAIASDDCTLVQVTFEDEDTGDGLGSFVRTWTATDGCNNSVTATTSVMVVANSGAIIMCAPDQIIATDENCEGVVGNYLDLVVLDGTCIDIEDIILEQSVAAGTIIEGGTTIEVTITATIPGGASEACTFNVTATDLNSPEITCIENQSLWLDETCSAIIPDYTSQILATDGCGGTVILEQLPPAGTVVSGIGFITITINAFDGSGNVSECSFTVEKADITGPYTTSFPEDVTVNCDEVPSVESVTVEYADACGLVTSSFEESIMNEGTCAGNYTIWRTWTLTDESGNTGAFTWTITVEDTSVPELLNIPADITINCGDEIPEAVVVATDNCDVDVTVGLSAETIQNDCGYLFVRTWTAIDECGNTATGSQTISVADNIPPVFVSVPADITINCGVNDGALDEMAVATDDCSSVTVTYEDNIGGNGCSGGFVRTWTATDGCGNSVSSEQVINIVDEIAPEITNFPEDLTVSCSEIPSPESAGVTYEDNCGSVSTDYSESIQQGACANTYTLLRTWTFTDACGNATSQTWSIWVVDETIPVLFGVPANTTINCGEPVEEAVVFATDNCSASENISISLEAQTVQTDCGSIFIRIWTATDECGNSAQLTQEITVLDVQAPVFTFVPADIIVDCGEQYELLDASAEDDCSDVSVSVETTENGDCSAGFTRTFTATDGCGNFATATQQIIINDVTGPTADVIPADFAVSCSDLPFIDESYITFTDNCSSVSVEMTSDIEPGSCPGNYTLVYMWHATDACGNSTDVTLNVTVSDTEGPVINNAPADLTLECGDDIPGNDIIVTDNCGEVEVISSDEVNVLACGYQLVRTWIATDDCGNATTAVQVITFTDTQDPIFISVPEDLFISCTDEVPAVEIPTAIDDCAGEIDVEFSESQIPGICANTYDILRTFYAEDDCGNFISYTQLISVSDNEAPSFFDFQTGITVPCTQSNGVYATASDDCSSISITYTDEVSGNSCSGGITRTYIATDACGNSTEAIQVITLIDEEDPQFVSFPADVTVTCANIPSVDDAIVEYTDNCSAVSVQVDEELVPGACANSYTLLRTWTISDNCLNTSVLTWTITVEDTEAPTIFGVPADVTIDCTSEIPEANVVAIDNCTGSPEISLEATTEFFGCGYVFTRRWTAVDECGNVTQDVQVTTVTDLFAPSLSEYPADVILTCGDDLPEVPNIVAVDNCDINATVEFTQTGTAGSCEDVIRTWCATDCSGNEDCYSQIISFEEAMPIILSLGSTLDVWRPTSDQAIVKVKAGDAAKWKVEVFNIAGTLIAPLYNGDMQKDEERQFTFSTSDFGNSVYIIRFTDGEQSLTRKLVVVN